MKTENSRTEAVKPESQSTAKKTCHNCSHEACNQRDWSGWIGCQGHKAPYVLLNDLIDTTCFPILHEEICLGLLDVDFSYTGGSHKYMGIVPDDFMNDGYKDYMQIIAGFSDRKSVV